MLKSSPKQWIHCNGAKPSKRVKKPAPKAKQRARFRPCIDIHKGKVKQIVGSTLSDLKTNGDRELVTNFVSERPSEWYTQLYRKDDLIGGHIIMLGKDHETQNAALSALKAWPNAMHVGGGIHPNNAELFLKSGASHIIVTSYIFKDDTGLVLGLVYETIEMKVDVVGADKIVLDLSCRFRDGQYWVVTDRWQKFSQLAVHTESLEKLSESCAEFLVHGVDVEGKQCGIDEKLIALLGNGSPIPVTYAGGVKDIGDLERVAIAGKGNVDVTVGSALDIFGGKLPYADVVRWHRGKE